MTESSIAAKLANLSPQQRAELLQRVSAQRSDASTLRARNLAQAPLSFAQSSLWVLDQVQQDAHRYNMVSAYQLRGTLVVALLERAFALAVDRHQVLKSRFVDLAPEPAQEVIAGYRFALPVIDLSTLERSEQDARLRELVLAEGRRAFDLSSGPLFRVQLYRLAAEQHVMQMNVHHAIFDGWSKGLLFREVETAYRALLRGEEPELPALSVQFADFAVWQREHMGPRMQQQLAYWQRQLEGATALLDLPLDFARPPVPGSGGEIVHLHLDAELLEAVRELARQAGATLFMTVLGAFMLLLHRCTEQNDICVASPVDNRSRRELHRVIGYFLNTVALRLCFTPGLTTHELLRAVRQMTLEAFQHQEVPFEQVVGTVAPVRSASFSPLNQVMFVFQHNNSADPDFEGLTASKLMGGNETTKFDLYATFKEVDHGLSGWITYRPDLFRAATVENLAASLRQLLQQMVLQPQLAVSQLTMLDLQQHEQALTSSRGPVHPLSSSSLHAAFAARAALHPERIAVHDEGQKISFGLLQQRALHLSSVLQRAGVRCGSRVGLQARRGVQYIEALLAIWAVGAAVVPLDPRQPAQRLRRIVELVEPQLLLHDCEPAPAFAAAVRCLSLGQPAAPLAADAPMPGASDAGLPAFILFTSGSTGEPKGVVGTHAGILNRLQAQWCEYPPLPDEIAAQRVNIGFVDSFTEVWATLLSGGSLAVIDEQALADPFELVPALRDQQVTTLYTVPSLLRVVLDAFPELQRQLPTLRRIICSGEPLTAELLAKALQALPDATLVNVYGATEAADASAASCAEMRGRARVPIGRPLSNMSLYVLDDQLSLCPIGVTGTLYAHGSSVAIGYWRDPGLTAQRFLPDPYATACGARMYCLGDRARRLHDGSIEYLGRRDHQLKLRGLRIEIAEIEHAIERCNGVLAAAVVAVPASSGELALVGYVCVAPDARTDRQRIATHLQTLLPDYMQPSVLVVCSELPHNATGKVDREALRARGLPELPADEMVAARTPTEQRLAQIWQEELRLQQVSMTAGFFSLGGHSLIAIRIIAKIREQLDVKVTAQELSQLLTIENVAQRVDALLALRLVAEPSAQQQPDDHEVVEF